MSLVHRAPTSLSQRAGPSNPRSLLSKVTAVPPAASAESSARDANDEAVRRVKDILKKEHEHHGQGKVMVLHVEGHGRRMTAGWDIQHVGDLSGQAARSVDYSFFG